jgi:hypothetical protein
LGLSWIIMLWIFMCKFLHESMFLHVLGCICRSGITGIYSHCWRHWHIVLQSDCTVHPRRVTMSLHPCYYLSLGLSQLSECWGLQTHTTTPGPLKILQILSDACNPSTQDAEAGGLWWAGQAGLHTEFKISLSYVVRPCLRNP